MSTTPRNFQHRTVQLNRRVTPKAIEDLYVIRVFHPGWNDTDAIEIAISAYAKMCGEPKAVEAARREWRARQKDGER